MPDLLSPVIDTCAWLQIQNGAYWHSCTRGFNQWQAGRRQVWGKQHAKSCAPAQRMHSRQRLGAATLTLLQVEASQGKQTKG
jgi:hypothetical protein